MVGLDERAELDITVVNFDEDGTTAQTMFADPAVGALPRDLVLAMGGLYVQASVAVTRAPQREQESGEYGACRLDLEGRVVVFRVAKTTPTKVGQFVTLWKRPAPADEIAPFDASDAVDFVIVSVADATHCGQFVFDQQALLKHGVMSRDKQGGKRAIRVYPPWSHPVAKEAIRTQQWQSRYFVVSAPPDADAVARLRHLLRL
ncbi:MAG: MepB family protein [Pseudomonadota bacterium]